MRNGRAAESVAHRHGAECSGIAKQVSFELQPGRYTLELSRSGDADLGVVIRAMP